jgi:hypothetical protein
MNLNALIYLAALAGITALTGCDTSADSRPNVTEVPVVKITGVTVKPLDREGNNLFHTDTLKNQVVFSVYTESEVIGYEEIPATPVLQNDQMPGIVANPTEHAYSSVCFNKPIRYFDKTIDAKTNLIQHPAFTESSTGSTGDLTFNPSLFPFATGQARLNTESFRIAPDDYEIVFQWGNEEGEYFRDTVQVHINTED